MKIYLTRHGQTDWNLAHKLQGRVDIALNKTGEEQAQIAKEKLKDAKIDLIICSPLKRAKKTAEIINTDRKIPIIYDERIAERDCGEFEGKTVQEMKSTEFWNYEKNIQYEKAEDMQSFFNRVYGFLNETKEKYQDKNILLVTHGGVTRAISGYFNGANEEGILEDLKLNNCEIRTFETKR